MVPSFNLRNTFPLLPSFIFLKLFFVCSYIFNILMFSEVRKLVVSMHCAKCFIPLKLYCLSSTCKYQPTLLNYLEVFNLIQFCSLKNLLKFFLELSSLYIFFPVITDLIIHRTIKRLFCLSVDSKATLNYSDLFYYRITLSERFDRCLR